MRNLLSKIDSNKDVLACFINYFKERRAEKEKKLRESLRKFLTNTKDFIQRVK